MPERAKVYSLRNDFVFKFVFGSEGNERLLARLLDALLGFEGEHCIEKLTILNPFHLPATPDEKWGIVDVKAVDFTGRRFVIEMQVRRHACFIKRMACYLARLYSDQLQQGEDYGRLAPAYAVAICDFVLFPGHPRLHSTFILEDQDDGHALDDLIQLHFIELPKYRRRPRHLRTRLESWLHVIKFGERYAAYHSLPKILQTSEELAMAIDHLRRINADVRMRIMLQDREKAETDRLSDLNEARREGLAMGLQEGREKGLEQGLEQGREQGLEQGLEQGREQGRKEGRQEGLTEGQNEARRQIISTLLASGMTIEEVSSRLKIPAEEILSLVKP